MKFRVWFLGLGVATLATGGAIVLAQSNNDAYAESSYPIDITSGKQLYGEYCVACHGSNLEGQGDWRSPDDDGRLPAPPHDESGHTWHHPDSLLFTYTKLGGKETLAEQGMDFNSGMPGFNEQLSDEEIWNVLAYIKSTWPERIQNIQAERSAADIASKGD